MQARGTQIGLFAIALAILVVGLWGRWPGRFQMQPFDGERFVRLDTVTGEFAICSLRTGILRNADTITCEPQEAAER